MQLSSIALSDLAPLQSELQISDVSHQRHFTDDAQCCGIADVTMCTHHDFVTSPMICNDAVGLRASRQRRFADDTQRVLGAFVGGFKLCASLLYARVSLHQRLLQVKCDGVNVWCTQQAVS